MDTIKPSTSTRRAGAMRARPRSERPGGERVARHRTSETELRLIVALCILAGIGGALSGCAPTALGVVNVALSGGFAALVAWAASRARRWTWLVLSGVTVLGASGVWLVVTGAALVIAVLAAALARRRFYGALVGGLVVQAMLRMPEFSVPLGSTWLVVAAVTPVLVSAYIVSPRRIRRRIHLGAAVLGGAALVGVLLFGLAAALAAGAATRAADQTQAGLEAVKGGSNHQADELLSEASTSFEQAHSTLGAWWAKPALAVPVVAQHLDALETATAAGADVTGAAARSSGLADYDALRYKGGRVDTDLLRSLRDPLAITAERFETAGARVHAVRSPWLVGPVAAKVAELDDELAKVTPEVRLAADAADVGPGLLGADGVRHYFIAFITPAEQRGLGGFMGSWAVLTADHGHLELTRSGRTAELNDTPGRATRAVTGPTDYVNRYRRFQPGYYMQDVTLSPDMPSVAQVIAQLYPETGGEKIDGVIAVDPYGLASLLELTGPIKVEGYDGQLSKDNAAKFLVEEQYVKFASNPDREHFLERAGRGTFEKLTRADLPAPKRLSEVLAPAVEQRRIRFVSFDGKEQDLERRLGVYGALPPPGDNDFFAVTTQNKGNNKIDVFMHRKVAYSAAFDPATGAVAAHATVTIRNDAPAEGLPDSVIGSNDQNLPKGTNVAYFSFYSPLALRESRVNQLVAPLEFQLEGGYSVYSKYLTIPPGGSVTVELDLAGNLPAGTAYTVRTMPQPSVNADDVVVTVEVPAAWRIERERHEGDVGLALENGGARAALAAAPRSDVVVTAETKRR